MLAAQAIQEMRIFSSAEQRLRVAQRIPLTISSDDRALELDFCLIFAPWGATVSQQKAVPNAKRVAVIFNPLHLDDELTFVRRAAESLGINLTAHPIHNIADLDAVLRA